MKKLLLTFFGALLLIFVIYKFELLNARADVTEDTTQNTGSEKLKKKVTGVGGIFFKSKDPKQMKAWYEKHLGMKMDQYGSMFEFRSADQPEIKRYLQWSLFKDDTKYFQPSVKEFMVNYRVADLESLLEELRKEGVEIVDTMETFDYGKFVHIMDPEGNKIELWEPVDTVFTDSNEDTATD